MICPKCNKYVENSDTCPLCGYNFGQEDEYEDTEYDNTTFIERLSQFVDKFFKQPFILTKICIIFSFLGYLFIDNFMWEEYYKKNFYQNMCAKIIIFLTIVFFVEIISESRKYNIFEHAKRKFAKFIDSYFNAIVSVSKLLDIISEAIGKEVLKDDQPYIICKKIFKLLASFFVMFFNKIADFIGKQNYKFTKICIILSIVGHYCLVKNTYKLCEYFQNISKEMLIWYFYKCSVSVFLIAFFADLIKQSKKNDL